MLLARISFVPHMDHEEAELVAVSERFLTALLKNGQIVGEYNTGWRDGIFEAFVSASHRESLHTRYNSRWVAQAAAALKLQFGAEPECEILDDDVSVPVPTLKSATSLYLYGDGLTFGSGVRHGNRGTALPLPLLPIDDDLREDIFLWRQSYVNLDRVWFGGGPLELAAYHQLADPNSELMVSGRALAARLEKEVKMPVFLYLLRHWGDSDTEANRPCPGCGKAWAEENSPAPSHEPFHRFHFRCEPCRLVSHQAVSYDEREMAEIGSFLPASPVPNKETAPENDESGQAPIKDNQPDIQPASDSKIPEVVEQIPSDG